ncbi:MAG: peptide deformylase [Terrisporobacter sp.]|uniref:peptide deformylase n=1 Tax=Terrisporobacter sp. TaxID=1965305 RepID=UPI002FC66E29
MAIRKIAQIGEPVLRKKAKVVEKFDKKLIDLLDDMADTMYEADGVGLAAPQVSILKRVVVIDIGDGLIELINPEIIGTSGEQIDSEGCLSVVGESGDVKRPYVVRVRAQDRNGNTFEIEGEELLARAFCHEIDHLDGILFVDKVER